MEWVKPPVMDIPTLFYKDLYAEGLKNDSTMTVSAYTLSRTHAQPTMRAAWLSNAEL